MSGDLPPSSSVTFFTEDAATAEIRRPVAVDPVNETMSTSGCATRASPALGPSPGTRLKTPGGTPASWTISASIKAVRGAYSLGFTMTVHPIASAGATFTAI